MSPVTTISAKKSGFRKQRELVYLRGVTWTNKQLSFHCKNKIYLTIGFDVWSWHRVNVSGTKQNNRNECFNGNYREEDKRFSKKYNYQTPPQSRWCNQIRKKSKEKELTNYVSRAAAKRLVKIATYSMPIGNRNPVRPRKTKYTEDIFSVSITREKRTGF